MGKIVVGALCALCMFAAPAQAKERLALDRAYRVAEGEAAKMVGDAFVVDCKRSARRRFDCGYVVDFYNGTRCSGVVRIRLRNGLVKATFPLANCDRGVPLD